MSASGEQPRMSTAELDAFLASVEKQAFVMAKFATGDSDAALDIVQDAMFKLVRQYGSRPAEEWRPLFFRILNNRIMDQHRKRGFVQRMSRWFGVDAENDDAVEAVDQLPSAVKLPEDFLHAEGVEVALREAYQRLPRQQQQAFSLRQWQGLSVEETALAMSVSSGSVKTHLSRALKNLREQLHEYKLHE